MKNIIKFTTVASLAILVGCSSSSDDVVESLAATLPEDTQTSQGSLALGAVANPAPDSAIGNVAVFTEENADATDFPALIQGANGNLTGAIVSEDEATDSFVARIGNENFTFRNDRFSSDNDGNDFLVSDNNRVAILEIRNSTTRDTEVGSIVVIGEGLDSRSTSSIDNFGFLLGVVDDNGDGITNTPLDQLPAQANYAGRFLIISEQTIANGTPDDPNEDLDNIDLIEQAEFTAVATFGQTNTLEGSVLDEGNRVGEIDADITGNTFAGTVNEIDGEGSATLNGGFFGVNGQEILGSGSGVINGEQSAIAIEGSRTDNMPTN